MRGAFAAIAVFAIASFVAFSAARPPSPLGAEVDPVLVSAGRARASLARILGDGAPHPVGSAAHALVVQRVVEEFARVGVEMRVEDALVAGRNGVITRVRNIVGRIPGTAGATNAIAIACHHDSVAAGPGAADDGAGVAATIEIVRALKQGSPLEHDLVVLITDGEEVDLSGAVAFVSGSPEARDIRAVVNLEARGTTGPAYLFQTGPGIGDAIARYAANSAQPATSSIAALVYDKLPNDTDLTVFMGAGWTGLNFAFIGGVRRYHTPRDDLAHLDDRSLQHLADGGLAGVRALDTLDLTIPHVERAELVWHDVLGRFVVRWPRGWSPAVAVVALGLLVLAARRARVRVRDLSVGALALVIGVVAAATFAWIFEFGQRSFHETRDPWFAEGPPFWSFAMLWIALLGATLARFVPAVKRAQPHALLLGAWSSIAALGLVVAILEPAACAVFVLPALVAGVVALALGSQPSSGRTTVVVLAAFLGGAAIWLPFFRAIEDALGYVAAFVPGAIAGLSAATLAPLLVRAPTRFVLTPAAVVALLFVFAARHADRTIDTPSWTNAIHVQSDTEAHWSIAAFGLPLPTELANAEVESTRLLPWARIVPEAAVIRAPRHAEPAPRVEVVELEKSDIHRRLRLRIASARGAANFVLALPAESFEVERVRSGSLELLGTKPRGNGWMFAGIGADGIEIELVQRRFGERLTARLAEFQPGWPAGLAAPFADDPTRVPRGRGHGSIVAIEFDL